TGHSPRHTERRPRNCNTSTRPETRSYLTTSTTNQNRHGQAYHKRIYPVLKLEFKLKTSPHLTWPCRWGEFFCRETVRTRGDDTMDLEQRVTMLEQEVQILKNQIQATLLDIQEHLLTNAYPSLRAEDDTVYPDSAPVKTISANLDAPATLSP